MSDGTDAASPGGGQRREAWLKEPLEAAERRCTPHLFQMIRRERLRRGQDVPLIDGRVPTVHFFFPSPVVPSNVGKTPLWLAIRSLCASIQIV